LVELSGHLRNWKETWFIKKKKKKTKNKEKNSQFSLNLVWLYRCIEFHKGVLYFYFYKLKFLWVITNASSGSWTHDPQPCSYNGRRCHLELISSIKVYLVAQIYLLWVSKDFCSGSCSWRNPTRLRISELIYNQVWKQQQLVFRWSYCWCNRGLVLFFYNTFCWQMTH
jgi:hypothetical protein